MSDNPRAPQNPEGGEPGPAGGGTPAASGVENPDAASAGMEAMVVEAEQRATLAQAGASDDLLALRDAVEATLMAAAGEHAALSDAPSEGIVGVGIGLPDPDGLARGGGVPGQPSLTLFTVSAMPQDAMMSRLARSAGTRALSSVPVHQVPVGVVDALSHRARHRPAPGGCSVGHVAVTAGTLGSRAIGTAAPWNNRHLVLSNNHVLANSNAASVNDSIIQPGRADGGQHPADQIAVLARWVPINFSGGANFVDCAFGWAWHDRIRGEQMFMSGGSVAFYRTGTTPMAASLGMIVGKSGRTTGLTQGRVTTLNVSVNVNYNGRLALFRDQIAIQSVNANPFSAGGDSGSLIWRWANGVDPVGLLFAGGGGTTFANPIGRVLSALAIRLLP